jgi:hypothetical protein
LIPDDRRHDTLPLLRRFPTGTTGAGTTVREKPLDTLAIYAVFEMGFPDLLTASCDDRSVDHEQKHEPRTSVCTQSKSPLKLHAQ